MPYIDLDAIDLSILRALQDDGRLTNAELADRVGLSASPCLRRVKRLERDGFVRGYRAVLDREAVGLSLTVFLEIRLATASAEASEAMEHALGDIPQVVACHMLSGPADFLAELVVPNVKAFEHLLSTRLRTLPHVGELRANIALKRIASDKPLPLTHLKRAPASAPSSAPDC